MINRVCIHGNLAQKPSIVNGCCRFEIATNETFINKNGEKKSKTIWHPCSVFGKAAEVFCDLAQIGSGVLIDGKLTNFDLVISGTSTREHRIFVETFFFTEKKNLSRKEEREEDEFNR